MDTSYDLSGHYVKKEKNMLEIWPSGPPATPVLGDPTLPLVSVGTAHTRYADAHAGKMLTHIKQRVLLDGMTSESHQEK